MKSLYKDRESIVTALLGDGRVDPCANNYHALKLATIYGRDAEVHQIQQEMHIRAKADAQRRCAKQPKKHNTVTLHDVPYFGVSVY